MASSSRLKPGEKGKIIVSVNIADRVGPLSKTVQVFTNDPENPVAILSVKMNIEGSPLQK
jgi:hypothetical protein